MVTTMNVTCTQATLRLHENLCMVLFLYVRIIWICQSVSFFFFCPVLEWFCHALLPVRAINCNLVQWLLPYYVIISIKHLYSFTCTISHMHRRGLKTICLHKILCTKKYVIYEALLWFLFLRPQTIVQLYIIRYYSSVKIGFNMNNKRHTLPIVGIMLV